MKTLMAILVGVGLVALCSNAPAATVLPDEVLGELYAASRLDINDDIKVVDSALASQSNIAAIGGGSIVGSNSIANGNSASVTNFGNSAVALQSNIGVAGANNAASVNIANSNSATVTNHAKIYPIVCHAIQGMSVDAKDSGCSLEINELEDFLVHSAVALQSNIAAICAGRTVSNSHITNTNTATVTNYH